MAALPERWGQGRGILGRRSEHRRTVEWGAGMAWAALQLHSSDAGRVAEAFVRMAFEIDVRDVVPAINVPTLIVHAVRRRCLSRRERPLPRPERSPVRSTWSSPGGDHVPWFDPDETLAEIREFLTGQREAATPDRMLATVLFTDLVGSTARAAELGDRRWRDLLEQHHASVRRELARFDGREVDTAGDGFFATFDGPARGDPLRAGDRRRRASRSASTSGPDCTRARSSSRTARSRGSPSTSARASRRRPTRARCSCRARCGTSSPAPGSRSRERERPRSRACPASGGSSPSSQTSARA